MRFFVSVWSLLLFQCCFIFAVFIFANLLKNVPVMTARFIIVFTWHRKPSIWKNVSKKFHIFTARKRKVAYIPTVHKLPSRFYDSFLSDKTSFLCHMWFQPNFTQLSYDHCTTLWRCSFKIHWLEWDSNKWRYKGSFQHLKLVLLRMWFRLWTVWRDLDNWFQVSTFHANTAELICPDAAKIGNISCNVESWKCQSPSLSAHIHLPTISITCNHKAVFLLLLRVVFFRKGILNFIKNITFYSVINV